MATWPAKTNYATGDVLTAAQMQDIGNALNSVGSAQYAAGKNAVINGAFDWNQRAFSSSTTTGQYVYDRFVSTNAGGTVTFSTQVFTPGTAPVTGYEAKNYVRCVTTGQSAVSDSAYLRTRLEGVRTFAGQTVTLSFWAKANTGTPKVGATFLQVFGTGGSPSATVTVNGQSSAITTSWARYSFTFAIPSISGKTIGTANDDSVQLEIWFSGGSNFDTRNGTVGIQSNTFEIWGVQAESGSVATPFQTATGTLALELAACQRYYYRANATGSYSRFGLSQNYSTTGTTAVIPFPVIMRTRPTALEQSGTASHYAVANASATVIACSAVPLYDSANTQTASVIFQVASGLVAGNAAQCYDNNTSSAYLGWSAEL